MPTLTPSAPYWAMRSSGSGELPSCLLILPAYLVAHYACEVNIVEGLLACIFISAIIMRATQKNMISGPVTSVAVG